MNILAKIQNRFKKDELFGKWHTEDDSGFMIVMGSWIKFRKDGFGSYESWSNTQDETDYNFKGDFSWKRLEKNKISIQEKKSEKVELIEYELEIVNGREVLKSKQEQMGTVKLEGFWNFAQIMFRIK